MDVLVTTVGFVLTNKVKKEDKQIRMEFELNKAS